MGAKKRVKSLLGKLGLEIRRISNGHAPDRAYPFVRPLKLDGVEFDIWISNPDTSLWFREEFSHKADFQAYLKLVKTGERILEFGAHQGFHSLVLHSLAGAGGFVLGVEAHPNNAMVAQAQAALNHIEGSLQFINRAGSDKDETVAIADAHNAHVLAGEPGTFQVHSVTGDELDVAFGPFTMLKIDVEGFEQKVLRGCHNILARRPKIALEIHHDVLGKYDSSVRDLWDLIRIDEYHGYLSIREGDRNKLAVFDKDRVPGTGITSVFLEPNSQ